MSYKDNAIELRERFKRGEKSAEEITSYFLKRAKKCDTELDAFLSYMDNRAMESARKLDAKRKAGKPLGKLAGVPVVLKDNIQVKNEITTCGSKFLERYRAPFNATVVNLIEKEDGILIAKSNLDEFAMGSSTENSAYKVTKNPWNLKCSSGGSSGGSAAAVSAMVAPLALGSETGGSVRQPASFCGIYGHKPTYGRVSRFGLVAYGSSLDQIAPFARSIKDIALIMEVIAHPCSMDSTSITEPSEPYLDELATSIQGKIIGVPESLLDSIDPGVKKCFDEALKVYKTLGVKFVPIKLDLIKYSIPIYYIIATAEASTNLARFDGIRYTSRSKKAKTLEEVYEMSRGEGFGAEVKRRILLGTYVLSAGYQDAYYRKAQKVRALLIQEYKKAFASCDLIAMPTAPTTTFTIGAIQDPVQMYMQDIFTISANLTGIPSLNIPIGFDKDKKPVGMQLQGPQMGDARVFRFAYHYEKETKMNEPRPPHFDKEIA